MLSREVMGVFCLVVLWTTALLVAASALQLWRRMVRKGASLGKGRVGVIDEGAPFATATVRQVGRALDPADDPAIVFHDRAYGGALAGGALVCAGERVEVAPSANAEVWIDDERRAAAAACADVAAFDDAWAQAKKAKGWERTVTVALKKGDRVHLFADAEGGPVVANFDPHAWLAGRSRSLVVFAIAELFVCGLVTRIVMTPPVFSGLSTLGGVLGVFFFLGVTPIGVRLRDVARLPHEARLLGTWRRRELGASA